MKTFISVSLAMLALGANCAPSMPMQKRQDPGPQGTINAINTWLEDVNQVNSFLDLAHDFLDSGNHDALVANAKIAHGKAEDEPTELGILSRVPNLSDQGKKGAETLMANFPAVLAQLQDILQDPTGDVRGNIGVINQDRCCFVLPSVDKLWTAAAEAEGVSNKVNALQAPRPAACAFVTCN